MDTEATMPGSRARRQESRFRPRAPQIAKAAGPRACPARPPMSVAPNASSLEGRRVPAARVPRHQSVCQEPVQPVVTFRSASPAYFAGCRFGRALSEQRKREISRIVHYCYVFVGYKAPQLNNSLIIQNSIDVARSCVCSRDCGASILRRRDAIRAPALNTPQESPDVTT